jgi:hypothetical protein
VWPGAAFIFVPDNLDKSLLPLLIQRINENPAVLLIPHKPSAWYFH